MSIGDKERLERLSNELIGKDWFMTFPDFYSFQIRFKKYLIPYILDLFNSVLIKKKPHTYMCDFSF